MIQMRVFSSISECEDLRPQWQSMLSQSETVTPFHTFEWMKANLSAFRNDGIRVLVFTDGLSEVAGILPLVLRRGRRYLNVRRWIEFAGLPYADYAGSLVRPGREQSVAQGFLDFLKTAPEPFDAACLERLRADDPFTGALISMANQQGWLLVTQPSARVRRLSADAYFEARGKSETGASLDKARRRLAAHGELRLDVLHRPEEILEHLETFARLHVDRFSSLGEQSPLASSEQRNFYRLFVQECAGAGYLWFSRLTCNDNPVAMRISLFCNQTLHLYSTCFAKEFGKYSPSVLQLQMLLEHAFHNGVNVVDFGVGESPHKLQAGAAVQSPLMTVELFRNRSAWAERQCYGVADRIGGKWPLVRGAGRILRRLFPYQM